MTNIIPIVTSKKFIAKSEKDIHNGRIIYDLWRSGKIKKLPTKEAKTCRIIRVEKALFVGSDFRSEAV